MNAHGGKREGAGRKPTREERRVIKVTLPSALYNRLKKLGGGACGGHRMNQLILFLMGVVVVVIVATTIFSITNDKTLRCIDGDVYYLKSEGLYVATSSPTTQCFKEVE